MDKSMEARESSVGESLQNGADPKTSSQVKGGVKDLPSPQAHKPIPLATFAHELKTPLAIISGYVDFLLDETPGALSVRQRQILKDVEQNCRRLQKFAGNFLTSEALNADRLKLKLELSDLNACLTELCGFWLEPYRRKDVALYFAPHPALEPFLFDYFKIQSVVSNLLDNSLKHTPACGTVWVTVEFHEAVVRRATPESSPESETMVKVSVADTGTGIPAEYWQEIFDEFFRVPTQSEGIEGSGLGLAIARRLVQAHGGKIWVDSVPTSGTRISFLLPIKR